MAEVISASVAAGSALGSAMRAREDYAKPEATGSDERLFQKRGMSFADDDAEEEDDDVEDEDEEDPSGVEVEEAPAIAPPAPASMKKRAFIQVEEDSDDDEDRDAKPPQLVLSSSNCLLYTSPSPRD